jgi:hypothetical protein
MTKNEKISKSLKLHYRTKKTIKSVKKISIFIAIVMWVSFLAGAEAKAPEARQWGLPVSGDRTDISIADQIRIVARQECNKKDLGRYCEDDLMAMAWTESRFNVNAIGDNGASQGLYQIHLGYHPEITQAQARDIEFSTNWTLNRLIAYGYPVYRSYAVMKHNGTPNTPNTLAYLSRVNNY